MSRHASKTFLYRVVSDATCDIVLVVQSTTKVLIIVIRITPIFVPWAIQANVFPLTILLRMPSMFTVAVNLVTHTLIHHNREKNIFFIVLWLMILVTYPYYFIHAFYLTYCNSSILMCLSGIYLIIFLDEKSLW